MINPSHYPFLNSSKISILELDEQSILHCQKNIEKYTPTNIKELDIPVWLISTIILRNLNNNYLTRKFVSNYCKLVEHYLLTNDINNKEIRTELLQYFGIDKDIEFIHISPNRSSTTVSLVKIHVMDYLDLEGSYSTAEPRLKLVNQVLEKGFVILEKPRFVYLLRISLEQKLIQKIKSMKLYTENKLINQVVEELRPNYPQYINFKNTSTKIPYSIQELIDKAYREHHLTHHERIKLGIYLQKYGYDIDYILEIFRQLSDWNEKITRYQLQSLKRYIKE